MSENETTAAQAMIDLLVVGWGVRHIFGLPGDGINPLVEALRRRQDDVQFVQVRHEEAAAFAAVGYAKFTGRLGVCLATTGPGATNLITGLYDAKMDRVPVLAITGLPYHDLIGQDYQQDVDTDRLMTDVAAYSERVMGPGHVDSVTNLAVRAALSTPGVGHIAFPVDFQEAPMSTASYGQMSQPHHTSTAWSTPHVLPTSEDLERAAAILNEGRKVAMLIGSGARGAAVEIEEVADLLGAPVAKALLGKDVLPDDNPYLTGGIGPIGTTATEEAMQGCDTFLMVGTAFPYISYLPKTTGGVRGVQIDINPQRIGLRFPVEAGLVGNARETLRALIPLLHRKTDRSFLESVQQAMARWRQEMEQQATGPSTPMKPQAVARELSRLLDDDAIICGDSGSSVAWVSRDLAIRGRQRFSVSGLLASMGCGITYAIGAQLAFPERQVVAFVGDGAFTMLLGELATLIKYRLPVKIVVLNNNALGFIRWEQMMYSGNPEYGIELENIDFTKVAEAFGVRGLTVEKAEDLSDVLTRALHERGPVVVTALVDPYEPALPAAVKPQQAEKLAAALAKGEPEAERVGREVYEYSEEVPGNEATVQAMEEQTPHILREARKGHPPDDAEAKSTMARQAAEAPERPPGR